VTSMIDSTSGQSGWTPGDSASPVQGKPPAPAPAPGPVADLPAPPAAPGPVGGPPPPPPPPPPNGAGKPEWAWGAIVVIAGLLAIVAVFVVAVLHYHTAAEVTTAVGAVSGVIAALVGAYFGIRGAILGQANAEPGSGTPSKTKV
jgi:hypothetical protein